MSDRPSESAPVPVLAGKVTNLSVTYVVETATGPRVTFHGLRPMRRYACPDRVAELTGLLEVICEQVLASRPARSVYAVPQAVRMAAGSSPGRAAAPMAPCRALLDAVAGALDCAPPADAAGQEAFLRVQAERARLVLAALAPLLAERGPGLAGAADAAALLRQGMTAGPAVLGDGKLRPWRGRVKLTRLDRPGAA